MENKFIKHELIDKDDLKNMQTLNRILKEKDNEPNTMTLQEFDKYIPMFYSPDRLTEEELEYTKEISKEFAKKVDLYKSLQITLNGEVILEFPAKLTPTRDIDLKYVNSVDKFNKMSRSDVPRYRAEACNEMITSFLLSQLPDDNLDRIRKNKTEYIRLETKLKARLEAIRQGKLFDDGVLESILEDTDVPVDAVSWEEDE